MSLRPYQQECVDSILKAREKGTKRQLVSVCTGGGKSVCFGHLPQHSPKGKRTLLTVHTKELVEQAAEHMTLWNPGKSVSIEMADKKSSGEDIVCASIQTIGRDGSERLTKFNPDEFDWIICDEAHRSLADQYIRVFEHFNLFDSSAPSPVLASFTATPRRGDGQAMGAVYEEIVFSYGIQEAINDGWLSDVRGIRVKTTTDISKVGTKAGEFDQAELNEAVNTEARNEQIVEAWLKNASERQTIGFTVTIQHAKDIADCFMRYGVAAQAIWGADPDRTEKLKMHKQGVLKILLCSQLLTEGYDDKNVSCVLMCRPTKSSTFFIQAAGRGARLGPGIDNLVKARAEGRLKPSDKVDMILMDFVDTTTKHSLITLPTLFGLGPQLDLSGQSVMAAVKAIEEVQAKYPDMDMSKLTDIRNLKAYTEEASLFRIEFCQEITEASALQWHRYMDNSYRLLLPGKEQVVIAGNMLGTFTVKGTILGSKIQGEDFISLPDALAFAESHLSSKGKSILTLLRREAAWHKGPITEGQLKLMKQFRMPAHIIKTHDKGSAHIWINKELGKRRR